MYYCIKKQKTQSYSHWPVTITLETANLHQSKCRKINGHLEIYTKDIYSLQACLQSSMGGLIIR